MSLKDTESTFFSPSVLVCHPSRKRDREEEQEGNGERNMENEGANYYWRTRFCPNGLILPMKHIQTLTYTYTPSFIPIQPEG